jgi:methylated-DNA-[protein]-cysteine S-methyltransferase
MTSVQYQFKSKLGPIFLLASEKGLVGVYMEKQDVPMVRTLSNSDPAHKILRTAADQLKEYFQGKRKRFDLPLVLEGTTFQKKVWRELSKIPYGLTHTYKEIAQKIRHPRAVRAVGNANGKNRFCIILPCHRVIATNGTLGGYSYGLEVKRRLLKLESTEINL